MTAQEKFDQTYISSTQIMRDLGVTRSTMLHARQRGMLPDPIVVNDGQLYLWERATIQQYLDAWRIVLSCKKGVAK